MFEERNINSLFEVVAGWY